MDLLSKDCISLLYEFSIETHLKLSCYSFSYTNNTVEVVVVPSSLQILNEKGFTNFSLTNKVSLFFAILCTFLF